MTRKIYDPAAEGFAAARQEDLDRKAHAERVRLAGRILWQTENLAIATNALRRICELPTSDDAKGIAEKALRLMRVAK